MLTLDEHLQELIYSTFGSLQILDTRRGTLRRGRQAPDCQTCLTETLLD